MKCLSQLLFIAIVFLFDSTAAVAQIEPGPIDNDSFKHELNTANVWYSSGNTAFTFSMLDVLHSFCDAVNYPDRLCVTPGEELLDNSMLSALLVKANLQSTATSATVFDTAYFAYDGWIFERQALYTCERKGGATVNIDGDSFANVTIYRIHETTTIWKHQPNIIDSPWRIETYYFSVPDTGTHIVSTLSYWKETMVGLLQNKFIQNSRSNNQYRVTHQQDGLNIKLGPVPANNQLKVTVDPPAATENISFDILNMEGKFMQHRNSGSMNLFGSKEILFNVSSLPSGVYILKATSSVGNIIRRFEVLR